MFLLDIVTVALFGILSDPSTITPSGSGGSSLSSDVTPGGTSQIHYINASGGERSHRVSFTIPSVMPASGGCGSSLSRNLTPGGASKIRYINSSGGGRSYRVSIPENYDTTGNTKSPLILSFHGSGGTARKQERISELSSAKWNTEYIVVYPNGIGKNWQGPDYATPGVSDIEFTSDLITAIQAEFCIDDSRIYATGKSNGGGFVGLMTCDAGLMSKIRAFAPVAGAFYHQFPGHTNCVPSRSPVPIIQFHGEQDRTINTHGGAGRGGALPSVTDWIADKAARNGCANSSTPESRELVQNNSVVKDVWYCGNAKRVLVRYNEMQMAHTWPGGPEQLQPEDKLVKATPMIIDFFNEWS